VYTDTQLQGHYPQASQEKKKKKKHFSPWYLVGIWQVTTGYHKINTEKRNAEFFL
jgi:hypothetical protein